LKFKSPGLGPENLSIHYSILVGQHNGHRPKGDRQRLECRDLYRILLFGKRKLGVLPLPFLPLFIRFPVAHLNPAKGSCGPL